MEIASLFLLPPYYCFLVVTANADLEENPSDFFPPEIKKESTWKALTKNLKNTFINTGKVPG